MIGFVQEDFADEAIKILKEDGLLDFFDASIIRVELEQLGSYFDTSECINPLEEVVQWLDDEKAKNYIFQKRIGLNTLKEWGMDSDGYLSHKENRFFKIIGVDVTARYREVMTWGQPILDNEGTGIIGLLMKRVDKKTYFLMQAKADVGNRNIVQLGPTVQFNPGNYIDNEKLKKPFLYDEFIEAKNFIKIFESRQSEEGGRFYKEEHEHKILMLPPQLELKIPAEYRWFSYNQIRFFIHMGDFVNSCARSILSCLI